MNYISKKVLILVIIVVCNCVIGCKHISENEVIIHKNEDYIKQESENTYIAPEKLKYSLESNREGIKANIDIDASVIVPEYAPSKVSVKPKKISFDQLNSLINLIVKDEKIYHSSYARKIMTKKKIQERIYYLKQSIIDSNKKEKNDFIIDNIATRQKQINKLYNDLKIAPESYDDTVINLEEVNKQSDRKLTEDMIGPITFTADNYNNMVYEMEIGEFCTENSERLYINATDNIYEQIISYRSQKKLNSISIKDFNLSLHNAKKVAEPYVNSIDSSFVLLDNWLNEIYDEEDLVHQVGYTLVYGRQYNGVNTNYVSPEHSCIIYENESKHYPHELIYIEVCENGVYSLMYQSPMEVIDTLEKNPKLLPFDKIKEIFNEHILKNKSLSNEGAIIKVNRIQLGMMRINNPNNSNEYPVVPVWDFYGSYSYENINYSLKETAMYDVAFIPRGNSFLTINAIDGSIIDR